MHHYTNKEVKIHANGAKVIRKVHIKGNKGFKSVSHYKKGRHMFTAKKHLTGGEISNIKSGKFISGLFQNCVCTKAKTRKSRY